MTAYLWTMLILMLLASAATCYFLAENKYPRKRVELKPIDDVFGLIWRLGFAAWTAWLIWGHK